MVSNSKDKTDIQPVVLWLLGPTSSGKTTIATAFVKEIRSKNIPIIHYDGDEVRDFFGPNHGFASSDRLRVVKTLVHLANKACDAGFNVIVSALTANNDARSYVYKHLVNAYIVNVVCPKDTCASRDPKGLYRKAKKGEIDTLIGFNSKYMPPEHQDFSLDTGCCSVEESTSLLMNFFLSKYSVDL